MMALWHTTVLPLLTLQMAWLFPHASFGVTIKCRWHRVSSVSHNVSIECQADPQGSTLDCDLCHLHMLPSKAAAHVSQTECSPTSANFSTLIDVNEIQNADCALICPGHTPGRTLLPCIVQEVYPPPTCLIPFDDERNIHCHWTRPLNSLNPTNFTLHWRDKYRPSGYIDVGESYSGIIPRDQYTAGEDIDVWISAVNLLGSVVSDTLMTNTYIISQPASPCINSHTSDPLDISWGLCEKDEHNSQLQCQIQYKKLCDQGWTQVDQMVEWNFALEDAQPFTTYKFRVRCRRDSDERAVMSDWSPEYTAETPAAAPVGMLDVWSDCDSTSNESGCIILWKEMPRQQARGDITSYLVTMKLSNNSILNINESVYMSAKTCVQCGLDTIEQKPSNLDSRVQQSYIACPQKQSCFHYCHLSIPVKEVKGIGVAANTAMGKSSPALVALPRTAPLQPAMVLDVRGKSHELNVSWSVLHPFSDTVDEYVVQHKTIGQPHTPCLNWVRVHKNKTYVTLRGLLSNYTAYNVSLFAIVNNRSCLLKSTIAYTVEGVPPKVTGFQAIPTSSFSANLTWMTIPVNNSQGRIMQYLVHFDKHVHKVNSNQSSLQLSNLNPDQHYEVWISAKTGAGEGERTAAYFTTPSSDSSGDISKIVAVIVTVVLIIPLVLIISIVSWCLRSKVLHWFNKIPDPINSSSFRQMSNQLWHSWPLSSASTEYGVTISQVEVVPKPEVDREPEEEQPEEHRDHDQSRVKELQGYGGLEQNNPMLCHQKEYSQMHDSSDEEGREDEYEEWNEQPFASDYEKHFLPCTVDA